MTEYPPTSPEDSESQGMNDLRVALASFQEMYKTAQAAIDQQIQVISELISQQEKPKNS